MSGVVIPLIVLVVGVLLHVFAPEKNRATLQELARAMIWVGVFFTVAVLTTVKLPT
jgi:hypothetical protein